MSGTRDIWLVRNEASGSNDEAALESLETCCGASGFHIARQTCFPDEELPGPADLDASGIDLVVVFTGDGTLNATITKLSGWSGQVLVLPGGTMNLLYHRLHGEREMDEVLHMVAAGRSRPRRPGIVSCRRGVALAGLLAGPGTSWYDVRETMRDADVLGMVDSTASAIEETLAAPGIACRGLGREEGYPLIMLTPHDEGIEVTAFHSDSLGDYLSQGWALLKRDFRQGPHDTLGCGPRVTLRSTEEESFGILIDGEKSEAEAVEEFVLAPCEVDLLATAADD